MKKNYFLTNETEISFLDKIKSSLSRCKSFRFSVSFIKKAGLILLSKDIEEALERGAEGYLITSTYQNFTDIASLEVFLSWQEKFPNFKCKLDFGCFGEQGFHTKGYIFEFDDEFELIIGSSNFTRFALLYNKEWDMSVCTSSSENVLSDVLKEFNIYWNKTYDLDRDIIKRYSIKLEYAIQSWDMDYCNIDENDIYKPNAMQKKALKEIKRYHDMNINRCLVVAATGSGKTYLAAFDAQNFDAHKVLFIVHRDTILVEAMKTFRNVFGNSRTYGLYTGEYKELDADFIFASNQILSRNVELFVKDEFDYIVIDEVHHAAASTYQKIINYFNPQFLLGLTATPERMDEKSIYDLFGNNVPYDLRLRDAIENDLVVPFHYYGIKDRLVSYEDDISKEGIRKYISQLTSNTHCSFVDGQIKKHLPNNGKLKCIGFCKNVEHARLMSEGMQKYGYTTTYLTGNDPTGVRIKKFGDLQDENNSLNIIFAVDVLNEGVDIPAINMVLFLRPTESSAIFLQQLGRGLRKYSDKNYLTVLDFIGNSYKRSSQIAIALGTLSKSISSDKRTIQDYIQTDFKTLNLPGVIIELDKESKEEVLNSIEKTNFNEFRFLKQDYENFKAFLVKNGNIKYDSYPMPTDFLDQTAGTDLIKYTKKFDSYYDFLLKVESDVPYFNEEEVYAIRTLSWFLPLVRKHEFVILEALLEESLSKDELLQITELDEEGLTQALDMLMKNVSGTLTSSFIPLIKYKDSKYSLALDFKSNSFKEWFADLLKYGIEKYNISNYKSIKNLNLYCGYSGPKVFMAMNCRVSGKETANIMFMTGVHYINNELCLFVTLKKDAQKEERLKYQDYFISDTVLHWESQTDTTIDNTKGKKLLAAKFAHIFVRKTKKDDGIESPFIYIGIGELTKPVDSMKNQKTLLFNIVLQNSVPFEYKYDLGIEDVDDEKN